jgi:hypothetical protein
VISLTLLHVPIVVYFALGIAFRILVTGGLP